VILRENVSFRKLGTLSSAWFCDLISSPWFVTLLSQAERKVVIGTRRTVPTSKRSAITRLYDGRVHSRVFILFLRARAFLRARKDPRDFAPRSLHRTTLLVALRCRSRGSPSGRRNKGEDRRGVPDMRAVSSRRRAVGNTKGITVSESLDVSLSRRCFREWDRMCGDCGRAGDQNETGLRRTRVSLFRSLSLSLSLRFSPGQHSPGDRML